MAKMRTRIATLLAATAVTVGATLGTGAGTAAAAPRLTVQTSWYQDTHSVVAYLYADGKYAGYVNWNADPVGTDPGDALRANDDAADGWGVKGIITNAWVYREASTQGHSSPYTTSWKTGDLDEGQRLSLDVCLVKGSEQVCSRGLPVRS
ncbi:hypothetical protein M5362_17910 [Streptomyces sp. Je 1-79]|uniref:hypothetical protein n=1 Tax=Streptomyces sp. Je 1-79 TaxID=2943847 RepID=UPI0021A613CA|nr:hypothetical protein [Streptomyces sp. Je 1-79]MCT4355008.1 hypothetical protein [Streptomyces sp. Je 1-79]